METVPIVNDLIPEETESFTVQLRNLANDVLDTATIFIIDDDGKCACM